MPTKQRTIRKERSIKGKSLHTGEDVSLTIKPAEVDKGFVFRRIDLFGKPEINPVSSNVTDLVRSTTISNGNAKVHTIEHVLSALTGCGIDNAIIELDASEPPILDGSARPFVNLIGRPCGRRCTSPGPGAERSKACGPCAFVVKRACGPCRRRRPAGR